MLKTILIVSLIGSIAVSAAEGQTSPTVVKRVFCNERTYCGFLEKCCNDGKHCCERTLECCKSSNGQARCCLYPWPFPKLLQILQE
uniref:Cysteine rich secreted protein n=1 Tax=Riptortus pedestris TaxID=329032 RepID=R4WMZ2_RIPPE|nr:cysteine rich secreted protein [Riptortus pedestris]